MEIQKQGENRPAQNDKKKPRAYGESGSEGKRNKEKQENGQENVCVIAQFKEMQ